MHFCNSVKTKSILTKRIRRFSHGNISVHSIASTVSVESTPMLETLPPTSPTEEDADREDLQKENLEKKEKQETEAETKAQGSVTFGI